MVVIYGKKLCSEEIKNHAVFFPFSLDGVFNCNKVPAMLQPA